MSDKDQEIALKLRDSLNQLVYGKVTEKKKQVENVKLYITNPKYIQYLNKYSARKDCQGNITWKKIFTKIKDFIEQESEKLQERENANEAPSSIVLANRSKDKKACTEFFRFFVKAIKTNGQYDLCSEIMDHIMAVLQKPFTMSAFGLDYSNILLKEILCEPYMCLDIMRNLHVEAFDDAILYYCKKIKNPPSGWDRNVLTQVLYHLLFVYSNFLDLNSKVVIDFFMSVFEMIKLEIASAHHRNIFQCLQLTCQTLKGSCRLQLCELGEKIILPILQLWKTQPSEKCKELMLEFLLFQMALHHPKGVSEEGKGALAHDLPIWKNNLLQIYQMVIKELNEFCGKNKYSSGKESTLKPSFIAVAVEACAQIFLGPIDSLDMTFSSVCDTSVSSKRRRIDANFKALIYGVSPSASVPWLQVISAFLFKYPHVVSTEDIESLLDVIIEIHLSSNDLQTKIWFLKCCQASVYAYCSAHSVDVVHSHFQWHRLWELGIKSVALMHQCHEAGHKLLSTMLFYKLVTPKTEFFNLYTQGSSNKVTKSSLFTLSAYLSKYTLPHTKTVSGQGKSDYSDSVRSQLLEWLLSRKGDDDSPFQMESEDMDSAAFKVLAHVVIALCIQNNECGSSLVIVPNIIEPFPWITDVENELLLLTFNYPPEKLADSKKNKVVLSSEMLIKPLWDKIFSFFLTNTGSIVDGQLDLEPSRSCLLIKHAALLFEIMQTLYFQGIFKDNIGPLNSMAAVVKKCLYKVVEIQKQKSTETILLSDILQMKCVVVRILNVLMENFQNSSNNEFAEMIINCIPFNFVVCLLDFSTDHNKPTTSNASNRLLSSNFDDFEAMDCSAPVQSSVQNVSQLFRKKNRYARQETILQNEEKEAFLEENEMSTETRESIYFMDKQNISENMRHQLQCLECIGQLCHFISHNANSCEINAFPETVVERLLNVIDARRSKGIKKSRDLHLIISSLRCLLANKNLAPDVINEIVTTLKNILNKLSVCQDVCLAVVNIFPLIYPHITSLGNLENLEMSKSHLIHLIFLLWGKENNRLLVSVLSIALAKCLLSILKLDPSVILRKSTSLNATVSDEHPDPSPIIDVFVSFINGSHVSSRLFVATNVIHVFTTTTNIMLQSKLFEDTCAEIFTSIHVTESTTKTKDEVVNRVNTSLHFLSNIIIHAPWFENDSLFVMCKLVKRQKATQFEISKVLAQTASTLGYMSMKEYVESKLSFIIQKWLDSQFPLDEFPYMILEEQSIDSFFLNYYTVFVPLLFYKLDSALISSVAQKLELGVSDLLYACLPDIHSRILSWNALNMYENRVAKCTEFLESIIPVEIVEKTSFTNKLDQILISLLSMLDDGSSSAIMEDDGENNILNLTPDGFISTISHIRSKIDYDGTFVSYLCEKEDNLQTVFISLSIHLSKALRSLEQRRIILMYKTFLNLLLPELKSSCHNCCSFVIRDVVYSILNFMADKRKVVESDNYNFISCIELIHFLCSELILKSHKDIGELLPFIVTSLIPFVNEEFSGKKVLSLLSFLVIENESILSEYIPYIGFFPNTELFHSLAQKQCEIMYKNGKFSLEEELKHFLESYKMLGKATVEGLKHLCHQLSSRKTEMLELISSMQENINFSEDTKSSPLHQLICTLSYVCTPSNANEDVQSAAAHCLGAIGPVSLSTLVLQQYSHPSFETETSSDILYNYYSTMLTLLSEYLIDNRIDIRVTASQVLKNLFTTKSAWDFLKISKKFDLNVNLQKYIYPFYACCKSSDAVSNCQFSVNIGELKMTSLWVPDGKKHTEWITNLVCSILRSGCTKNNFYETLIPICKKQPVFCEKIFPYIIHSTLQNKNEKVHSTLSAGICVFFAKLSKWLQSTAMNNERSSLEIANGQHFPKASVQVMLSVVHHLWLLSKNPKDEDCNAIKSLYLGLDYLDIAHAATYCSDYFAAILYTEVWCDLARKEAASATRNNHTDSFGIPNSSPLSFISSIDQDKASLGHDILLDVYTNIGNIDAMYGCEKVSMNSEAILRHNYMNEKKWDGLLQLNDMKNLSSGILQALQHCGLNNILQGYVQFLQINSEDNSNSDFMEYQCQAASRMGQWNLPQTESASPGLQECLYRCQQNLCNGNSSMFNKYLELFRKKNFESLSHTSLESTRNILPILGYLQMITSLDDFSKQHKDPEALQLMLEDWENQDKMPFNDFEFAEPVAWLKCILLKHQIDQDANKDIILPKLIKFLESYAVKARSENSLEYASTALHMLKKLPVSDEVETLRWQIEEANVLWTKKESRIANKILKSALQSLGKNVKENPNLLKIYGKALILGGKWLAETCSENSSVIMQDYLEKAVEILESEYQPNNDEQFAIGDAYIAVARYSDTQYQSIINYKKSMAYQTKQELMQSSREEAMKMRSTSNTEDQKKTLVILMKQHSIDDKELQRLETDRQSFLIKAVKNYLLCLKGTDAHDLWIFRLISLWFQNLTNEAINQIIQSKIGQLDTYKFLPLMYQLAARMGTQVQGKFQNILMQLIKRIAEDHPHHALPVILALSNADKDPVEGKNKNSKAIQQAELPGIKERMLSAKKMISMLQNTRIASVLSETIKLCDAYISLAYVPTDNQAKKKKTCQIPSDQPILKIRNFHNVPVITEDIKVDRTCQYANVNGIYHFESSYSLCGGITLPKVVTCKGLDGRKREQLVKGRDDLRQDAVMQQVFSLVNYLLLQKMETKRRKLRIRTYKVVPVSRRSGVIQWCEGTQVLAHYLVGAPRGGAHHRYYSHMGSHMECITKMKSIAEYSLLAQKREIFDSICTNYPPVFRYFFLENFPEPSAWFERRQSYTKSVAASSIVGYILGLGDRHVNNILVDKTTAEVIHIDFGIAFEKGLVLTTPETVPFRLTRDIVDGMGISGVEGTFKRCCEKTLEVMRNSQDVLLTILEVLLYDPLYDWTVPASKQASQGCSRENTQEVNKLAERALMRLQQKLQGLEEGVAMSIEGQVNLLIQQARDPNNLCRLYAGWQPYL